MRMHNPPHAGEIISGILEDLSIGVRDFARAMDIAPSTASRLISGTASLTPDMAIKLAAVLGSTPEMWMRLQTTYSLEQAAKRVDLTHISPAYRAQPLHTD